MKDFPIEIIEDIIDYVDPRYLFSLRTTNRSMHAMVTPRAFRCIRVQDSIPLVRKRYNLLNDSHLAPLIEEVVYTEHSGGLEGEESSSVHRVSANVQSRDTRSSRK